MTEFTETENVQALKLALKDLQAIRGLAAGDIEELVVSVRTTQGQVHTLKATPI